MVYLIVILLLFFPQLFGQVTFDFDKHPIGNIYGPSNLEIEDMNNDDTLEVVAVLIGYNKVVWYDPPSWTRTNIDPNLDIAIGVGIGDLDGDGTLDVVAAGQFTPNPLRLYYGPDWNMYPMYPDSENFAQLAIADLDNDTDLDVITSIRGDQQQVAWFENLLFPPGIEEDRNTGIVFDFLLEQNYPNPFNPVTMINYQLPVTSAVELSIYNLLGQKVATLVNERKRGGYHQVEWDASGFASGIYLYRLSVGSLATKSGHSVAGEAEGFVETKKMVLIR